MNRIPLAIAFALLFACASAQHTKLLITDAQEELAGTVSYTNCTNDYLSCDTNFCCANYTINDSDNPVPDSGELFCVNATLAGNWTIIDDATYGSINATYSACLFSSFIQLSAACLAAISAIQLA